MMYSNKLAVAIKANGRVLREFGDKVYIPFGTEYTILIKNLHTTRALVNIDIDGTKATENGLVIDAGREVELERFLKTDLNKGNRFKFIERTSAIEKHRGIKLEDGLVNVTYQFEKEVQYPITGGVILPNFYYNGNITITSGGYHGSGWGGRYSSGGYVGGGGTYGSSSPMIGSTCDSASPTETLCSVNSNDATRAFSNEEGITVPGSISEQKFVKAYLNTLESTVHSMVIKLLGETDDNKPVCKPVTVSVKPICITCGKKNKATNRFCANCGSSLQILA